MAFLLTHSWCVLRNLASVWDPRLQQHQFDLSKGEEGFTAVCLTDEGRLAITGSSAAMLHIWDLTTPPPSSSLASPCLTRNEKKAACLALSHCGGYLVSAKGTNVVIWDSEDLTILRTMSDSCSPVQCLFILKDSKHFLMGHENGSISLCNGESGEIVRQFAGNTAFVTCLTASYDSRLLMSGSNDGQVAIWSMQQGSKLKTFRDHSASVVAVSFTPATCAHNYIFSADEQGKIIVKEFETARIIHTTLAMPKSDALSSLDFSANGEELVCGYRSGNVRLLAFPSLATKSEFFLDDGVTSVAFLPTSEHYCVVVSSARALQLWDITSKQRLAQFLCDDLIASTVADQKTNVLFYGCADGHVGHLWHSEPNGSGRENPILQQLTGSDKTQEYYCPSNSTSGSTSAARTTPTASAASMSNGKPSRDLRVEEVDFKRECLPAHTMSEAFPHDTIAGTAPNCLSVEDTQDKAHTKQSSQREEGEKDAAADREGRLQSRTSTDHETQQLEEKPDENKHQSSSTCTLI